MADGDCAGDCSGFHGDRAGVGDVDEGLLDGVVGGSGAAVFLANGSAARISRTHADRDHLLWVQAARRFAAAPFDAVAMGRC